MKKSLYTTILCILSISPDFVTAQLNHFIYLQTEGKQPFYAKLDKKILSSSASGYLIIPKLKDGAYNLTIGFPKNENGEQIFVCNINNNDLGYLVKNFGDKGWGLFNLQTLEIVMSGTQSKEKDVAKAEKGDEFSNMLSDVVNDPSIKYAEKPKVETKPVIDKKDKVKEVSAIAETPKSEPQQQVVAEQHVKEMILKKQVVTGDKGTVISYIDVSGDAQDTIDIFIPVENPAAVLKVVDKQKIDEAPKTDEKPQQVIEEKEKPVVVEKQKPDDLTKESPTLVPQDIKPVSDKYPAEKKEKPAEDGKFLPIEIAASGKPNIAAVQPAVTPMINSDCKSYATDEDFLKLRKKMAGAENDDEMIIAAQKAFKAKCYTTDQVKNLCVLFLKDAGKYKFFDLAYQYVSDSQNFGILESQLTESYYISRFKAMIRH